MDTIILVKEVDYYTYNGSIPLIVTFTLAEAVKFVNAHYNIELVIEKGVLISKQNDIIVKPTEFNRIPNFYDYEIFGLEDRESFDGHCLRIGQVPVGVINK